MTTTVQIAAYIARSKANGPGLRSVLWVQGCALRCQGCFNSGFWPFNSGQRITVSALIDLLLRESTTEGVSFSGGEPFSQPGPLAEVAMQVQAAGKGVLIFTGFTSNDLRTSHSPQIQRLLAATDLLVAGPYEQHNACKHPLLASANQELVYLTERYRNKTLGTRKTEYHISNAGDVTVTGFPLKGTSKSRVL